MSSRSILAFAGLPVIALLASCSNAPAEQDAWWDGAELAREFDVGSSALMAAEVCDRLVDNDGDKLVDEGCTGTCDWFITRSKGWWTTHPCVLGGGAGVDFFADGPITVGSSLAFKDATAVRDLLAQDIAKATVPLLTGTAQFIVVTKLNIMAFGIGGLDFADCDGDGADDTVQDCLDLAESRYEMYGSIPNTSIKNVALQLRDASNLGTLLTAPFSETCSSTAVEECDGVDNDGDGSTDEFCVCLDGGGTTPCNLTVADLVAGDLVVTEIMQNPDAVSDTPGEWFEIYNASGCDVDLDGLMVDDDGTDGFAVSGTTTVVDGDWFVFGADADTGLNGGATVDYDYSGFTLGNSDDEVVLWNGTVEIDRVNYDGGPNFPDPTGASMNLNVDTTDAVSNDSSGNWCEAVTAFGLGDLGTPGAANDTCAAAVDADGDGFFAGDDCDDDNAAIYPGAPETWYDGTDSDCSGGSDYDFDGDGEDIDTHTGGTDCDDGDAGINTAAFDIPGNGTDEDCDGSDASGSGTDSILDLVAGDLIITEIMKDPFAVVDTSGEYFEIYVNRGADVDLNGLEVYDLGSNTFTVSGSFVVSPGQYYVLGVNSDLKTNGGVNVDYVYSSATALGNGDDELYLSNGTDVIDFVEYDDGAVWVDPKGFSMQLNRSDLMSDNNDGTLWCATTLLDDLGTGDAGTPGAENQDCPTVSFATVDAIFTANCATSGCHDASASGGMDLVTAGAWLEIVNVPSEDVSTMDRVEPGDTDNSYLYRKIKGTQLLAGGSGAKMPLGGSLSTTDQGLIETWIVEGGTAY